MLNQTPLVRMTSELPPSTREPGRRGKQGETRARLIQVAIELVRTEGLAALTTSRITRAAGIAQPGFYAHFRNVEEVLQTAVMQVIDEMREKVGAMRRRSFERFRQPEGLSSVDATRAVYQDVLEAFLSEPAFAELLLRYHRDTSPLGATMRRVMDRIRAELTEDMWRNVEAAGFGEEHRGFVSLWTDQILALYFAGAEALLDGRYQDKSLVLDSLARSSFAIMRANLRALEATRAAMPAPAQPSTTSSGAPVSKSGPAPRGSSETATAVPALRGVSASRKSAKRA